MKKETLRVLRADHLTRVVGGDRGGNGHQELVSGPCLTIGEEQGYGSRYCND